MSIVETIRQPLLVLDTDLRVKMANKSFYRSFQIRRWKLKDRSSFPCHMVVGIFRGYESAGRSTSGRQLVPRLRSSKRISWGWGARAWSSEAAISTI